MRNYLGQQVIVSELRFGQGSNPFLANAPGDIFLTDLGFEATEGKLELIGKHLVTAIPELRSQYESELEWWGNEQSGAHIIFGDILNPYLISLLELGDPEETIKRIFAFLEQLANHEDTQIQEVVTVTVCERLGDRKDLLAKARQYMGNTTLRFSEQIEEFWGREKAISLL